MNDWLSKEVREGFYKRGASPFGSYPFLTKPTPGGRWQRMTGSALTRWTFRWVVFVYILSFGSFLS